MLLGSEEEVPVQSASHLAATGLQSRPVKSRAEVRRQAPNAAAFEVWCELLRSVLLLSLYGEALPFAFVPLERCRVDLSDQVISAKSWGASWEFFCAATCSYLLLVKPAVLRDLISSCRSRTTLRRQLATLLRRFWHNPGKFLNVELLNFPETLCDRS